MSPDLRELTNETGREGHWTRSSSSPCGRASGASGGGAVLLLQEHILLLTQDQVILSKFLNDSRDVTSTASVI